MADETDTTTTSGTNTGTGGGTTANGGKDPEDPVVGG